MGWVGAAGRSVEVPGRWVGAAGKWAGALGSRWKGDASRAVEMAGLAWPSPALGAWGPIQGVKGSSIRRLGTMRGNLSGRTS